MLSILPPAKINLFLTILAQEAGGFHQLETVFAAVGLHDELTLEEGGRGIELEVTGADLGDPRKNLVYQAAEIFLLRAGVDAGFRIRLVKRIPHGAGLGGGSSDAAAMLRLLQTALDDPLEPAELRALAADLGADVAYFLSPTPLVLAWGRGDRMLPLELGAEAQVVLALPDLVIPTSWAYRTLAERRASRRNPWLGADLFRLPGPGGADLSWLREAGSRGNDFEGVVFRAHPELEEVRRQLEDLGAVVARLSGSGGAVFGMFEGEGPARDAQRGLQVLHPSMRFERCPLLHRFPEVT